MKDKKSYSKYSDFIEDEDFVKWRLTKDESLESEWNEFIRINPGISGAFEEAVKYFERFEIHKELLTEPDRSILLERIQDTYTKVKRRRKLRTIRNYAAVACIILIVGIGFYYTRMSSFNIDNGNVVSVVEGIELNDEDIRLVTSSGTTTFNNDIYLQIGDDNTITVQQTEKGAKTEIKADRSKNNKLIVPYGKRSQIKLSDGTKIWLNSGSVLEFPASFTGSTRDIYLTGEIYADVAKDNNIPFHVHTVNFDVKVYGTEFNVSAYDNAMQSVVLVQGSVGVKVNTGKSEMKLTPNEMAILDNNSFSKKEVDTSLYTSWRDGYLVFDNSSVYEVLTQIARYYNLSFDYENIDDIRKRKCSGKIYLSDNLDNVLTTISLLSSAKYTREGQKIHISMEP